LSSGYTGIHLRKAVGFEIEDNNVSGHAYYGIKVSGRRKTDEMDARSFDNRIIDNDLSRLIIKTPDEYTYKKTNGKTFSSITDKPVTAHYWFDTNTLENTLVKSEKDSLIDEGKDNSIIEK